MTYAQFLRIETEEKDDLLDDDDDVVDDFGSARAELIARNMAKCPDLRPSTVVDHDFTTLSDKLGDPVSNLVRKGISTYSDVTRLATYNYFLFMPGKLRDQVTATSIARIGVKKALLRALYPNLSEIVILRRPVSGSYNLSSTLFGLIDDGYKVVLVGYQEQNHDREYVKKAILASTDGRLRASTDIRPKPT